MALWVHYQQIHGILTIYTSYCKTEKNAFLWSDKQNSYDNIVQEDDFSHNTPKTNIVALLSLLFSNHRYCVIVAYIGVSFVLYIVSRCNPTEWITETEGMLHNQFSFPNALWFSFAALVQQGSDLSPRFDQIHFKCSIVLWLCLTITSTKKVMWFQKKQSKPLASFDLGSFCLLFVFTHHITQNRQKERFHFGVFPPPFYIINALLKLFFRIPHSMWKYISCNNILVDTYSREY